MLRMMLTALCTGLFALAGYAADTYKLTGENTKIEFTGTKKNGKHDGGFKKCEGTVTSEGESWKIDVTIETESLYSDDDKLTGHLKAGDFFAVKDNPTAKFTTTKIEKGDKGYTVTGKLTLLGKTKEISFPAEITSGDTFTLKANFDIDRSDYGMTYGAGMIENAVKISVNVNAKK